MKARNESHANRRIDYHWPSDHTNGIETTSMIYDRDGRLVAIDYVLSAAPDRSGPRDMSLSAEEAGGESAAPPLRS